MSPLMKFFLRAALFGEGSDLTPEPWVGFSDEIIQLYFRICSGMIRLMEEILHQLICSLSQYLQGFIHPWWCRTVSSWFQERVKATFPRCFFFILQPTLIVLFLGGFSLMSHGGSCGEWQVPRHIEAPWATWGTHGSCWGLGKFGGNSSEKKVGFWYWRSHPKNCSFNSTTCWFFFLRKLTPSWVFCWKSLSYCFERKNGDAVWPFFFESKNDECGSLTWPLKNDGWKTTFLLGR